ncbi:MAG TPA: asparagine synthase (glutamine-hydrolyzing) [Roseococcus sp.]|nr:asparagine synthase (glutamine-hydrolyzing) [Roseococcus sp.]
MCGIVGYFNPGDPSIPNRAMLRAMADAIRHRGPDGDGFHVEAHLGFGHRRLAIVDLAGGAQPMATADGGVVVTFNGEIYNHVALRRALEAAGHSFQSHSDTEALLLGWREWGLGLLDRLDGMFAFALWDRERGELLIARDRLGEKPLHYAVLPDGGIAFASEIPALLTLGGVGRRLDPVAVDDFLALGYVPDPATIYATIRRLPPAHAFLLRRGEALSLNPRRFWQAPTRATAFGITLEEASAELATRLDRSVRDRLMADVPLGSFLSGGLDSGAVTALAAGAAAGIESFTIGFAGPADERPLAAEVSARHGTTHHAEGAAADYVSAARGQAQLFGEPFGDHSSVPTLAVCTLARRHVTVALSGDGGDEVFAGYRRHRFHTLADAARRLVPAGMRRRIFATLAAAYPAMQSAPRWLRARSTLTELSLDSAEGYYRTVCRLHHAKRRGLMARNLRDAVDGYDPAARFGALMAECDPEDSLLQAQYADIHTYLPGDILSKVDRTSMAVSLEVRPPILGHELVGWGMALPAALKLRSGVGKRVLRHAMRDHLPAQVTQGRKLGFAAAITGQFRDAAPLIRQRLTGEAMGDSGLFDLAALGRLVDEHAAGAADHSQSLWQLLVMEGFLDGEARDLAAAEAQLIAT